MLLLHSKALLDALLSLSLGSAPLPSSLLHFLTGKKAFPGPQSLKDTKFNEHFRRPDAAAVGV